MTSATTTTIDEIVLNFWVDTPWLKTISNRELECRFGYIEPFSRSTFENVIKKLKSVGFQQQQDVEQVLLRVVPSKINNWGTKEERIPMSCRMEITNTHLIAKYLKKEITISEIVEQFPDSIVFEEKKLHKDAKNELLKPAMFPDYNFKVSYTEEIVIPQETVVEHLSKSNYNYYRIIHRISFVRADLPFTIDFSVVENQQGETFQGDMNKTNNKTYEIEIEVNNFEIGPEIENTKCNTNVQLAFLFRKTIHYILSGIQQTNFPISLSEQRHVLQEYQELVGGDRFIGPRSKTIQLCNLDNTNNESIRVHPYGVTEKADGERHLLFISSTGKIYLINQTLQIIFTGCLTKQSLFAFTILDGELILHNKEGNFINLFAAFDIYFFGNGEKKTKKSKTSTQKDYSTDCRKLPLSSFDDKQQCRYNMVKSFFRRFTPISVVKEDITTPMSFAKKKFLFPTEKQSIFACNKQILKTKFPYLTDGLIFTSMESKVDDSNSLKWKPLEQNTFDFVVSFEDDEKHFADEKHVEFLTGNSLKRIVLKCGYTKAQLQLDPKRFVLNYYQSIGNYHDFEDEKSISTTALSYVNRIFIPTNPYKVDAGICFLHTNEKGQCFTTATNELICNGSIVEFSYDLINKQWIPQKIRHDKAGFGNNFKTANNNWSFLHCPVTEQMLISSTPFEPTINDLYYTPVSKATLKTNQLKQFHNVIKRQLLAFVLQKDQRSLIDFGCGKAGDLHKWMHNKLEFVLGIDFCLDNIVNAKDGCYARFLEQCFSHNSQTKQLEKKRSVPLSCIFVQGDCGKNIKNGEGIPFTEDFELIEAIFKSSDEKDEKDGKEDKKKLSTHKPHYPAKGLFDVSSCQFALHYFFKNRDTLKAFLVNVYNSTKVGGYFIGCCFDGKKIFELKEEKMDLSDEEGNRIFLLEKMFKRKEFNTDSSSLGMKITVYQESINQMVDEYLVNFEYLVLLMETIGFFPVEETELFNSKIYFDDIYKEYQKIELSEVEKKISFLNRLFIFQKKSNVMNPELIDMF